MPEATHKPRTLLGRRTRDLGNRSIEGGDQVELSPGRNHDMEKSRRRA